MIIRTRAAHGATGRSIAADYGLSESAVTMILTGKRWANVGGPIRNAHGNRRHGRYAHGR